MSNLLANSLNFISNFSSFITVFIFSILFNLFILSILGFSVSLFVVSFIDCILILCPFIFSFWFCFILVFL